MMKSIAGATFALLWIQFPVLAQAPSSCESGEAVEIALWRGAQPSTEVTSLGQVCLEDLEATGVQFDESFMTTAWGVPGLEEIAALVLASPQASGLMTMSSPDPEQPPVIAAGADRGATPGTRAVVVNPGTDGVAGRILHLMIVEASPNHLDVGVQSGVAGPIRLSWARTADHPEWAPGGPTTP